MEEQKPDPASMAGQRSLCQPRSVSTKVWAGMEDEEEVFQGMGGQAGSMLAGLWVGRHAVLVPGTCARSRTTPACCVLFSATS